MAIVMEHELGWIVDEEKWYNTCYENIGLHILPALYDISEQFRMDSQVEALNRRAENQSNLNLTSNQIVSTTDGQVKSKRRKRPVSNGNDDELDQLLQKDCRTLVEMGRASGHFPDQPTIIGRVLTNNKSARQAAKEAETRAGFPNIQPNPYRPEKRDQLNLTDGSGQNVQALASSMCYNDKPDPILIRLGDGQDNSYVIPGKCRFIWGDVGEELERLVKNGEHKFDLIIADPPWHNKTVKRQKTYISHDEASLEEFPIRHSLKPGALVGVWVTNNPQYIDFVIDKLLPRWGLQYEARWFWMKVTKFGEPVCDYRWFKKPYESIIFGRFAQSDETPVQKLPERRLIVSVPSALPSRKPPLLDILKHVPFSCLELYARYLLPDVFSIGDQVIKFQCQTFFE